MSVSFLQKKILLIQKQKTFDLLSFLKKIHAFFLKKNVIESLFSIHFFFQKSWIIRNLRGDRAGLSPKKSRFSPWQAFGGRALGGVGHTPGAGSCTYFFVLECKAGLKGESCLGVGELNGPEGAAPFFNK